MNASGAAGSGGVGVPSGAGFGAIGAGNMGGAIVRGSVAAGVVSREEWVIADRDEAKRRAFAEAGFGVVAAIEDLGGRLADDALVMLAIKPQQLGGVAAALRGLVEGTERTLLTILAGVTIDGVRAGIGASAGWSGGVIRAMPNTPASVGLGSIGLCVPASVPPGAAGAARRVLGSVGTVHELPEGMMDAFTGVAGSGPAYVFAFAEALASAARDAGFEAEQATRIACETVVGASRLLAAGLEAGAEPSPSALREAVTSKGGTTAAALECLSRHGLNEGVSAAVQAAVRRAGELANPL